MGQTTLITGGAGFIGAHLADELLRAGDHVRVLDSLVDQVHRGAGRPAYLSEEAELIVGDVRDPEAVSKSLAGVDNVVHLAARVGVGQSMYEIAEYTSVNSTGTGVLLEGLMEQPVGRLVVASSMSVYGEGLYIDEDGAAVTTAGRSRARLQAGDWEPIGADGRALRPVPTPETKLPSLSSVYALSKYDQERLCLLFGEAYEVPTVALRFFNVYGPFQALSNPYTGVLAIFASCLLNRRSPLIFEDGEQRRDFVSVHDVARACRLALMAEEASGHVVNVGSGTSVSINEVARRLGRIFGGDSIEPEITGRYRVGDIRHCFADVSLAHDVLGFQPRVDFDDGLAELAGWLGGQVSVDSLDLATSELEARGLRL